MKKFLTLLILFFISIPLWGENLTIEEIYNNPELRGGHIERVHWCFKNSLIYFAKENGEKNFYLLDLERRQKRIFINFKDLLEKVPGKDEKIVDFKLSEDGTLFIFSTKDHTYLYDTRSKEISPILVNGTGKDFNFSPDGNYISYIKGENIFIYSITDRREIKITNDGSRENIYGSWDWVYEEEFGISKGMFWSKNGRFFLFVNLKEKGIRDYPLVYTREKGTLRIQKYPYAGEKNPEVKILLFDLFTREKKEIFSSNENSYIPRIYLDRNGENIYIETLNRAQNSLKLVKVDFNTLKTRILLEEKANTWININDLFYLMKNNRDFLWGSERDGFLHLYLYKIMEKDIKKITGGKLIITSLSGVDEENEKIYLTGTLNDPTETQFYKVDFSGNSIEKISQKSGTHKIISISPDFKYYIDEYSDILTPTIVYLKSFSNPSFKVILSGKEINLREKYGLLPPKFSTLKYEGRTYYTLTYLPENFKRDKKHPVLIYVYGGPHYQVVKRKWKFTTTLFHEILAKNGFIVFSLDNRGSSGRGKNWEDWIYHHFGERELEDQLMGVNHLKSLPYVDPNKIAIWGWSFGGYMTLYALTKSPGIFKCGISVAPVTDWKLYDSIYTERYMGRPSENKDGYINSSPINFVKNIKSKLLLCFGTCDDNVHPVNSLNLIDRLIKNEKDFELYIYPNQSHSISKKSYRIFLFKRIKSFLIENLK